MKKYKSGILNEKEYDAVKKLNDVGMSAAEINTLTKWSKSLIYAINRPENWLDYKDAIRRAKAKAEAPAEAPVPATAAPVSASLPLDDINVSILTELKLIRQLLTEQLTTEAEEKKVIKRFWDYETK